MSNINPRYIVGAVAAAAAAVVGYLLINGIITPEIASGASVVIAGIAGYIGPDKTP